MDRACRARLELAAQPVGRLCGARCRCVDVSAQPDRDADAVPVARDLATRPGAVLRMAAATDARCRTPAGRSRPRAVGADGLRALAPPARRIPGRVVLSYAGADVERGANCDG